MKTHVNPHHVILSICCTLCGTLTALPAIPAFPGAEGFAAHSNGGRVSGSQVLVLSLPVRGSGTTFTAPGSPANGELVSATVDNLIYKIQSGDNLSAWILDVAEVPSGTDKTTIESSLPALSSGEWTYRTFRSPGTVVGNPTEFIRAAVITTP